MLEVDKVKALIAEGYTLVAIRNLFGVTRKQMDLFILKHNMGGMTLKSVRKDETIFEVIDTKEKAYWLGFLYADGCVHRNTLQVELSYKDVDHLYRLCDFMGVAREQVRIRNHKQGYTSYQLHITSQKIASDLAKLGCLPAKTFNIRLPTLLSNELDMAFLMGYYDGDGYANNTCLCSGSEQFLLDIKQRHNITFECYNAQRVYMLNLGATFKHNMIKNYPHGLVRKHTCYRGDKGMKLRGEKQVNVYVPRISATKKELDHLINVEQLSYIKIGAMFGGQ